MGTIAIKKFGGISPKIPPRYLPNEMAQEAYNCDLSKGSLRPMKDVGASILRFTTQYIPKTIYRFGQDITSDTEYWFVWDKDVDVCRGQINGDTSEWTFYTGDDYPKATYAKIATAGKPYPFESRPMGMKQPTEKLVGTVAGKEDDTETKESRIYTWTWVNEEAGFSMESAPAPASPRFDVRSSQTVDLTGFPAAIGGFYNATHKRIYRSTEGEFLFVDEIPATQTTYTDKVVSDSLGELMPSALWDEPPEELKGLINLPNGMMAGFVGRDVYFSVPYRPYAWPEAYIQSVDYPIVGLGAIDTTLVVLTTGVPYFIQGTRPNSVAVVKSGLEQACVSKRSIASWGGLVIFASPDGLVQLSSSGSKILTESYFTRKQWNELKPETIHAYHHDNKYIAFHEGGGFVYDFLKGTFTLNNFKGNYFMCAFNDLLRDKLFICGNQKYLYVWQEGRELIYTWTSKKYTFPHVMGFSCAQVEAENYPVSLYLYMDGKLWFRKLVTSREAFRLAAKKGREIQFTLRSENEVFSIALGNSMRDLQNV